MSDTNYPTTPRQIIRRAFPSNPAAPIGLPFVDESGKRGKYWEVSAPADYMEAYAMGRQYACDFLQFIKDRRADYLLRSIMGDMAPGLRDSHVVLGFIAQLQLVLQTAVRTVDFHAIAQDAENQVARETDLIKTHYEPMRQAHAEARLAGKRAARKVRQAA